MKKVLLSTASLILLTACQHDVPFAYKMDIQQGNILPAEKVSQVKVGMTQAQVEQLLGAPISRDTFQQNRWDYVYYFKKNHKPVEEERLLVYFNGQGIVEKVERHGSAVFSPDPVEPALAPPIAPDISPPDHPNE